MQEAAIKNICSYQSAKGGLDKETLLYSDITNLYHTNVEKFRPGKKSYGLIKQLIQKEIKANPKLVVATEHIKDPILEQYGLKIWPVTKDQAKVCSPKSKTHSA